jgi:hypothetical protein
MAAVFNLEQREGDRLSIRVTFLDESGLGLERVRVISATDELLFEATPQDPACPEDFQARFVIDRPNPEALFPIFADSAPCGTELSDNEQETYPDRDGFGVDEILVPIPLERFENTCFPEFGTVDTEEAQRQRQLIGTHVDSAHAIAQEIEELCAELDRHRRNMIDHVAQRDLFFGLALASAFFGVIFSFLPWPASLFGFALLAAAAVFAGLHIHHRVQADMARRRMEQVQRSIEEAQERYRQAVLNAAHANCGPVPELSIRPPTCD